LLPLKLFLIGYFAIVTRRLYDLVFTSDNFVFADVVYVQPPAGKDVNLTWDEMLFGRSSYLRLQWLPFLTQRPLKILVSKHAHFITNSHYARQVVRQNYGKDASVIYPPVPTHLFESLNEARENLVVTISGLNPRKNLELIAEVGKRMRETKFILLGYYQEEFAHILASIKAGFETSGIRDNFTYFPSVSDKTKVRILNKAKVYFHPTAYEPFGIGIAEGMAAGCIPVVHDSGGPREFVSREWRYENAEGAANKIRYALESWDITRAVEFRSVALGFGEERFKQEILKFVDRKVNWPMGG
jgi:glycosyltransferase involved in cell wall biosynthesis